MERELFVVSAQRSGSNWLQTCLSQHPKIKINGEVNPSAALALLQNLKTNDSVSYNLLQKKGIFRRIACHSIRLMIRSNLNEQSDELQSCTDYICDKTAFNLNQSLAKCPEQLNYISLLQDYFPDAKKILLIRDIRDMVVSISNWKPELIPSLLIFSPRSLLRFLRYLHNWCELHLKWINDMRGDNNCIIISYSEMKFDFGNTMKRIFIFLGLEDDGTFLDDLEDRFYSIKSDYYKKENEKRGYSFYRKGLVGEWKTQFKWYHKLIIKVWFGRKIDKINSRR